MKIILHFKEITLGELTLEDDMFVYNSNSEGEKEFKKYVTSSLYSLNNSDNLRSKDLFYEFSEIVKNVRARADILSVANIEQNDSDFAVLEKYGALPQCQDKYWIEVAE